MEKMTKIKDFNLALGVIDNVLICDKDDNIIFTGDEIQKVLFQSKKSFNKKLLDEIGEFTLPIQVKLLRVLQLEEFYRPGSTKNIKTDVRIIAATNKNLFDEIKRGNFRKDLFFRLNINSINLPPLQERHGKW